MNEAQIFNHPDFGQIRTVTIDGEPWFVGKDVALALGYTNPQKAVRDHTDEEDRTVNDSFTVNGTAITLINESGLYALILSSKLPGARKFKRWVTCEVLPAIRKTGVYGLVAIPPAAQTRQITTDDYLRAASIVANCRNERLPYVLGFLEQGGFSVPEIKAADFPTQAVSKVINDAIREHGLTIAQISNLTGIDKVQIGRYKKGEWKPRPDRAEFIVKVITSAIHRTEE